MASIYQAMYVCKSIEPAGLPGYNDVVLGIDHSIRNTDIVIRGTCSCFVVGKNYLVNVMELLS